MNRLQLPEAAKLLKNLDDVAVVFHKNPDGDALGSALALCLGLQQLNKRCRILSHEPIPQRFEFLFKGLRFEKFEHKNTVSVDLASCSLLENELKNIKIKLAIDHHLNCNVEAEYGLVNSQSAATCELIYDILKQLNVKINKLIAMYIYIGLATDTGCFKFSNTTAKTHSIAADLFNYGINFSAINFALFDLRTMAQLKLKNVAFNNLQMVAGGCCAAIFITRQMLENCGCTDADFFVVTDLVKSIKGVEVAVAARQVFANCFKFSVRTAESFSAARFCERFGGGGHERAAGFELKGELLDVKLKVLENLEEFFQNERHSLR